MIKAFMIALITMTYYPDGIPVRNEHKLLMQRFATFKECTEYLKNTNELLFLSKAWVSNPGSNGQIDFEIRYGCTGQD